VTVCIIVLILLCRLFLHEVQDRDGLISAATFWHISLAGRSNSRSTREEDSLNYIFLKSFWVFLYIAITIYLCQELYSKDVHFLTPLPLWCSGFCNRANVIVLVAGDDGGGPGVGLAIVAIR
jgi:hypothetical protein